jgi:hypothetical protein
MNTSRNPVSRAPLIAVVVLASILVIGGIFSLGYYLGTLQKGSLVDDGNNLPADGSRVTRRVSGTSWSYTVDPTLEARFSLKLSSGTDANVELLISGTGCNGQSASVTRSQLEEMPGEKERFIDGKAYYLVSGPSALIACTGERADWDQQLQTEIENVFESLKKG